jgi:DNA-binding transcriptional ArsR family regulator
VSEPRASEQGLDAVFGALADPTRRGLMARLIREGPNSATALARDLPVSRQAVVHHLKALGEAGLVDARRDGREVRYGATTEPMADAAAWMVDAGARWDRRLERLQAQVERGSAGSHPPNG